MDISPEVEKAEDRRKEVKEEQITGRRGKEQWQKKGKRWRMEKIRVKNKEHRV